MKNQIAFTALALLVLLPASLPGCPCDEETKEPLCKLLERLTDLAYWNDTIHEPRSSGVPCIEGLWCFTPPYCILAGDNGSFEVTTADPFEPQAKKWAGDETIINFFNVCQGFKSLRFCSTTPEGSSESRSSQVYQVVDYNALVPEAARATMRRVRVQGAFRVGDFSEVTDSQFGLRIDAYAGNAAAFPRAGDPETFVTETGAYSRLDSYEATLLYDPDGAAWQPLRAKLMLPDDTDFFVVLLEAYENVHNDVFVERCDEVTPPELGDQYVDQVEIVIDGGPYTPIAAPDRATTFEDTPVRIPVLANDEDWDERLDPATLRIVVSPQNGSAVVNGDGTVTYTPDAGYTGTDTFSYVFSDQDGFTAGALVTVEVLSDTNRPPVAVADSVNVTPGVATELDLLANDYDPDGDAIFIAAAGNSLNGTVEIINNGQAVRYTPNSGFTGHDFSAYLIVDEHGARSNEVGVTITVASQ